MAEKKGFGRTRSVAVIHLQLTNHMLIVSKDRTGMVIPGAEQVGTPLDLTERKVYAMDDDPLQALQEALEELHRWIEAVKPTLATLPSRLSDS